MLRRVLETCSLQKPIPFDQLTSKEGVLDALKAKLVIYKGEDSAAEIIQLLITAYSNDCLSLSDMQVILGKPVPYIHIASDCWLKPEMPEVFDLSTQEFITPVELTPRNNLSESHVIDLLLFIAELYDPSIDRLRIARRRHNVLRSSLGYDSRKQKDPYLYTVSPAQLCSRMVEKIFYNDKYIQKWSEELISRLPFPYWVYSAKLGQDSDWLIGFDENFQCIRKEILVNQFLETSIGQKSMEINQFKIYRRDKLDEVCQTFIQTLKNVLDTFCKRSELSMIGTPFFRPCSKRLHVAAKQVEVSKGDYIQVHIPWYLAGNHLSTLITDEFADLDMLMGRQERKLAECKSFKDYRMQIAKGLDESMIRIGKPRPNDNTLSEDEIQYGVDCAWRSFVSRGYSRYSAYEYITQIVAPWWQGEETLDKKFKRFLSGVKYDKTHKPMSDEKIIQTVTDIISEITESSDQKYLWARFCRERARVPRNRQKVRNTGRRGKHKGK